MAVLDRSDDVLGWISTMRGNPHLMRAHSGTLRMKRSPLLIVTHALTGSESVSLTY